MMNYIVGIGEILWDMLPEGNNSGALPQISHSTHRRPVCTASY